jgi:hypothetical protein
MVYDCRWPIVKQQFYICIPVVIGFIGKEGEPPLRVIPFIVQF